MFLPLVALLCCPLFLGLIDTSVREPSNARDFQDGAWGQERAEELKVKPGRRGHALCDVLADSRVYSDCR